MLRCYEVAMNVNRMLSGFYPLCCRSEACCASDIPMYRPVRQLLSYFSQD